ncbi:MAG: hypothetical protein HWE13_01900 [Gammaproteobacteria bacterium]|nr:hypothetical protein [Gammaproteobacteria bacterium]
MRVISIILIFLAASCSDISGNNNELTDYYHKQFAQHLVEQTQIAPNALVLLGDSLTEDLAEQDFFTHVVNYGIRQDTTYGLYLRVQQYERVQDARAIALLIGINDFWRGRDNKNIVENIVKIIDLLPQDTPVVVFGLLPVDERKGWQGWNQRIKQVNASIEVQLKGRGVVFDNLGAELIDQSGNLAPQYHVGDGVHLTSAAYKIWAQRLLQALNQQGIKDGNS